MKWANSLIVKNKDELDRWLIESLPQKHKLGNYYAFCYLDRNSSYIAVVLVKSKKMIFPPKWLIVIDFIIITLLIILYSGLCFGYWPQLNLRTRFVLSYALASVIPLSLLSIAAYTYLHEFENTSEELANNELQLNLKAFDSYKLTNIKEYKIAFSNVINDPKLLQLIEENGVKSEIVTDYVVNRIENIESDNPLPILGAVIYDESGEGAFSKGSVSSYRNIKNFFNSFDTILIDLLRDKIVKEDPNKELKEYKKNDGNDLIKKAYDALIGISIIYGLDKFSGLALPRKNGGFCGYQIFNTIKIDGKSKYIIHVMWDDKTLDDRIIKKAIYNNDAKNLSKKESNQFFNAFKVDGQKLNLISKRIYASEDLKEKIYELAKQSFYLKKTTKYVYKDNIIVVMPSFNFNKIIFVGWLNKIDIISDLFKRKIVFIISSILMLRICSLRSSSVFLKPITTLKKALDEVSLGNLNIGFKDNPDNELGKLSNEFDKMIEDLREKERLEKLISDQAVEALKKNSSGLLNDTETFKGVALVSDIRNFTGMSEKYDPGIMTELLNEHFAEMAKIISDNGGLIYKFIGDAIEAFFQEKEELKKSAIERAFQAASQMIIKLRAINEKRAKTNTFTYKIGVGLCYGTMYSGTVGSLETRLDYSIIGDPLKNAAKFEALTIQNPNFPLVVDEIIAEKMINSGLGFKKIDNKNLNYNLYTLDKTGNISNSDFLFSSDKESFVNDDEKQKEEINYFSFFNDSYFFKNQKDLIFFSFLILYLSLLITFGIILLYKTTYSNLKSESDKYAARLVEQLKCDGVIKSSFETLCFEFYDDLKKIDFNEKPLNLKDKIKQVAIKYEKLGVPIPRYCCCFLDESKISEEDRIVSNGFPEELCNSFDNYTKEYKKYLEKYSKLEVSREENISIGDETFENIVSSFTTKGTRFYNFQQGVYFRRSDSANIGGEEMLFSTERIYDKSQDNLIAYIFCGMPEDVKKDSSKGILPNYYTLLAGKQMLMAIKNENGWYFSLDFPEKEKELIKKDSNNKGKGYFNKNIDINDEPFTVCIISRDLLNNYYHAYKLIFISFISSVIILTFVFWFLESKKIFVNNSIASTLRKDICL